MDTSTKQVRDYIEEVETAFYKATNNVVSTYTYYFHLSDYTIKFSLAGSRLAPIFVNPLSHLDNTSTPNVDLEIVVWDECETGIPLPIPTWQWASVEAPRSISQINAPNFCAILSEKGNVFSLYDPNSKKGLMWIRDARLLPNYVRASPFFRILKIWTKQTNLKILHAGCVGDSSGSILLAGAGGAGKSTTSLLCALAGLHYLSDDYILVEFGETPKAFSLYNSGKLHKNHLLLFPELAKIAEDAQPDGYDKPIVYLNHHSGSNVSRQSSIKAVVAPKITGLPNTNVVPISAFEAIKALAPSTLMQLNTQDPEAFAAMAQLVRKVPCFRIELGTNLAEIPVAIKQILEKT